MFGYSFISPRSTLLGVGLLALTSAAITIPRLVRSRRSAAASTRKVPVTQKKTAAGTAKKNARRKAARSRSQKHVAAS